MKKIVWLDLNCSYSHSSLSCPLLQAACEKYGIEADWSVVRSTINDQSGLVAANVATFKPDVVLASMYLFNRLFMEQVIPRLKVLLPQVTIILGGPEFLGDNHKFLEHFPEVDAVVRGEGEETLPILLTNLFSGKTDWRDVKGTCFLNNEYVDNGLSARVTEISATALKASTWQWERPFVQLETTRGCFGKCIFCTSANTMPLVEASIECVREQLDLAKRNGIKDIRILDRTFNFRNKRACELLSLFREFEDMNFHLEIHPQFLSEEQFAELEKSRAGQFHLEVGVQSLSKSVSDNIGRNTDRELIFSKLNRLSAIKKLAVHADFIYGLPAYSSKQVFADVIDCMKCRVEEIQIEVLKVLPGTEIARNAKEYGLYYSPVTPYEVLYTDWLTPEEINDLALFSRMIDGFYNEELLQDIIRALAAENPDNIKELFIYLKDNNIIQAPVSLQNRFKVLHRFLTACQPILAGRLEAVWIQTGFSPQHGICQATLWKEHELPESVNLIYGSEAPLKESRTWYLKNAAGEFLFLFAKGQKGRQATAVYSLK